MSRHRSTGSTDLSRWPCLGGLVGGQSTCPMRTFPQILLRCFLQPTLGNPLAHASWGCGGGLSSWGRCSDLALSKTKRIMQPPKPQCLFRSSGFCLFVKQPSQAVLLHLTKSSFPYCCLVFACIKGQVCLEVWLYIPAKTVSELGCWCAAPTVAELSFVNRVLQSFIKLQMLRCSAVLWESLLGSSMNSSLFKSSNDLEMRRFFFSKRKNVQVFQNTKWLELTASEVLLTSSDMLASVSLWKIAAWSRKGWPWSLQGVGLDGL